MEASDIIAIGTFFTNLPGYVQVLITLPVIIYLAVKYHAFMEYKVARKANTLTASYSYTDTVLRNILSESINNMRNIMIDARGGPDQLTESDKWELQTCRASATSSLLVETKEDIKSFFQINGYIAKLKAGVNIDQIVIDRSSNLRDKSADVIDAVVRTSSPLYNHADLRFSKDKSVGLYRGLVDYHYQEVLSEERDINDWLKDNFGPLSRFLKYEH